MAAEFFVKLGNTFGQFIRYECPKCKQSKPISEYGGNLAEGVVCPDCGEDPIPSDLGQYSYMYGYSYSINDQS